MQTLSRLRRKSTNALSLKYIFGAFILVIYEILSTAFYYLPPLFGVFFSYIIIERKEAQRLLSGMATPWFLAFGFIIFAEQIHGFFFLSSVLVYISFYHIFYEWLVVNIKSRLVMFWIFSAACYIGIWAFSDLLFYIFDRELLKYSYEYPYYIVIEGTLSAIIFRKNKL